LIGRKQRSGQHPVTEQPQAPTGLRAAAGIQQQHEQSTECVQRRAKEEELTHVDRRKLGSNEQGAHRLTLTQLVTEALSQSYPNTPIPVEKRSG